MGFADDIGKEFEKINKERDRKIKKASLSLYGNLVKASPVGTSIASRPYKKNKDKKTKSYTGGELKASWQLPRQIGRAKYVITNIAPHAYIIDGGRRLVPTATGSKEVGSEQLPDGFGDIIRTTEKALARELNK